MRRGGCGRRRGLGGRGLGLMGGRWIGRLLCFRDGTYLLQDGGGERYVATTFSWIQRNF